MKIHLGRHGTGTLPRCSARNSRTGGVSVDLDSFLLESPANQCVRCAAKAPKLLAMRAARASESVQS